MRDASEIRRQAIEWLESSDMPPVVRVLITELRAVESGKKSQLFNPKRDRAPEQLVRMPIRAASAAALHVLKESVPLDSVSAAELISKRLYLLSISRLNSETGERYPVPPFTIIDWQKHRRNQSPEFQKLFRQFQIQLMAADTEPTILKRFEAIVNQYNFG